MFHLTDADSEGRAPMALPLQQSTPRFAKRSRKAATACSGVISCSSLRLCISIACTSDLCKTGDLKALRRSYSKVGRARSAVLPVDS